MKTIPITAFILLLSFGVAVSESTKTAQEEKLANIEGEARVNALIGLSYSFYEKQPDKAIHYAREALGLARKFEKKEQIIESYRLLAGSFTDSDEYDSAKYYYTALANYAVRAGDSLLLAESLSNIGGFYYYIDEYNKAIRYYDSANAVFDIIGEDTRKLYNEINISIIHSVLGDVRSSLEVLKKHEDKLLQLDKKPELATTYTSIGESYKKLGIYDSSRIYINKALKIAKETDNIRLIIYNITNLGDIEKNEGSLDEALKYYLQAIELAESAGIESYVASAKMNMANIYLSLDSNKLANKYYNEAYNIYKKIGDSGDRKGLASVYSMFGEMYIHRKMYDSAYVIMDKALRIFHEIEDKYSQGMMHVKLASVFRNLEEFDQSLYHLNIALDILKDTDSKAGLASAYIEFGKTYQQSGKYEKSAEYLEMAIEIGRAHV